MLTSSQPDCFAATPGALHQLADVTEFLTLLESLNTNPVHSARELFDPQREVFVTRAPGRLDVMGGIADYSGSLVLQLPLAEAAFVALQRDPSRTIRIVSLGAESDREHTFEMSLESFERNGDPLTYAAARSLFDADPKTYWASYVAGSFLVLMRERGVSFAEGARILVASNVPEGKGVSSSAAIEVAAMTAIAAAFQIDLAPRDLALLCQKVENVIVGAPCGVMDQMTAACGMAGELLALRCQPAELLAGIALPKDLAVWGVDSGLRHSVRSADYGSVRTGAFMGYRIIAELADDRWHGYLANITPAEFEAEFARLIPESMEGREFLQRYGETADTVTRVDPERTYAILKPTAHPIYENFRVKIFADLLSKPATEKRNELLGELMYESHESYSACGLGSSGTDLLVQLVREAGAREGLFGAKITGGGSGGTVAILGRSDAAASVQRVAARYAAATASRPYIFSGSSMGSAAFGFLMRDRS